MKIDIVKEHMLGILKKGKREDGRAFDEYREIEVSRGVSPRSAEGSARVRIGKTEVVAGVKIGVGEPYLDTPDEGMLVVNVELLPLSSPEFELGPPGQEAIELSRVVDRMIRESGFIKLKELCIKEGELVLSILIDIYPVNDGGNLFDAAGLAAVAALLDVKVPEVKDGKVNYEKKTKKGLPLGDVPVSCTVLKVGDVFIVDPGVNENAFMDARLTVGMVDDRICALQKGGDCWLMSDEIEKMVETAFKKGKVLRKILVGGK